jgi:DNA-binding MarR family transcriptional regulator
MRSAALGRTPAAEADERQGAVRLWLRLLGCAGLIERELRRRLAERFDTTLPRFDLMAQLDKAPEGLTLAEISRRMMVTNGNVTGLVDRLCASGHVERRRAKHDRRAQTVVLTARGRGLFRTMAEEHAAWVADLVADLDRGEREALMGLLARAKASVVRAGARVPAAE